MAEGLNRVMLLGNLGADPELRFTQSGQAILHLRLATTESFVNKDKQRQERTDWHSVVIWGKRGEALGKILTKGSSVFVEGRIQTSSYDDREGVKRYKTEIIANNVILAGRGGGGGGGGGQSDDAGGGEDYGQRGGGNRGGGGGYARGGGRSQGQSRGGARDDSSRDMSNEGYPRGGGGNGGGAARAPAPAEEAPAVDDYEGGGGFGGDDDIPFAYHATSWMRP